MEPTNKLGSLFNIRADESRLVTLFLLHSFFVGMSMVLVSTTASTLFLDSFQDQTTQNLPFVYIGSAIAASLTGLVYARLQKSFSFTGLLSANLGLLIFALVGFRLLFYLAPQAKGLAMGLYIWYYVQDALLNLEFWGLAGNVFNVRQSKRLFGLIGSGEMVARIISGYSIRFLVKVIDPTNLLLIATGGLVLCLAFMTIISQSYETQAESERSKTQTKQKTQQPQSSYRDLLKSRYILSMVIVAVLALLGYFFADIVFLEQTRLQYPDKSDLAAFMGSFFATIGLASLLFRTFLAGPLINKYGLTIGLLMMPLMMAIGAASIVGMGTIYGAAALLFWPAMLTKLGVVVARKSVDKSTFRILYQPMPDEQRLTAQTGIESIVEPVASGIAGVVLLLLSFGAVQLAYVLIFIAVIWIAVVIFLNREYTTALLNALTKRSLAGVSLSLSDGSSLAVLEQSLKSPHPGEVLYALDVMEDAQHKDLGRFLTRLVRHSAPTVRIDAFQRIERLGLTSTLKRIQSRLRLETSPRVLGTALRTYAALGETEVLEEVLPYLKSSKLQIKMGAMVGLLRSGGVEGVLAAGEQLIALSNSQSPTERVFAAEVLGEVGIRNFYRPLIKLLRDDSPHVRRTALTAAGKLKNAKLWPLVIENLSSYQTRASAVAALVAGGEATIPFLTKAFDQPGQTPQTLIQIARACGRIKRPAVIDLFKDKVNFPNEEVRKQILTSLSLCRYQAHESDFPLIFEQIKAEVANATWTLAGLVDLKNDGQDSHGDTSLGLLETALNYEVAANKERTFLLLSFIYEAKAVLQARDALQVAHTSRRKKAYALEIIDVLIAQELKPFIVPLLQDLKPAEQVRMLRPVFPQQSLSRQQRLRQIISGQEDWVGPWTKACALYSLTALRQSDLDLSETVVPALSTSNPLVRETAVWMLANLAPVKYRSQITPLLQDPDPHVVNAAVSYLTSTLPGTEQEGGSIVLSTLEKVLILKTTDIFSETPDDVLAEVATILDEIELKADETIFEKDDPGNSMYIIIEGRVRMHDGDQTIAELGERKIFGELTILDSSVRSTSATAVEDSRLFCLEQEPFYELMADQIKIVRGVLKVLTRRLRNQNVTISRLRGQETIIPVHEQEKKKVRRPLSNDIKGILDKLD